MKIKQFLFITNPDKFLKGDYNCFSIFDEPLGPDEWILCGEIEIDVDVDSGEIVEQVVKSIKDEIVEIKGKHDTAIGILERRLGELTALPAPENNEETREEIGDSENRAIDSQEHSHNKRSRT